MARADAAALNVAWHTRHDESKLCIWINVDQVFGTSAIFEEVQHYARPDEVRIQLAKIRTDAVDGSHETKMDILRRLLILHANRLSRGAELGVEPF